MIVNPGKLLFSAIGSLTQPLFNKGLNVAQLKIAKAQQEEARLAFQQALLNDKDYTIAFQNVSFRYPGAEALNESAPIEITLIENLNPYVSVACIMALFFFGTLALNTILFSLNLWKGKFVGLCVVASLIFMGYLFSADLILKEWSGWLSIACHVNLAQHQLTGTGSDPKIGQSILLGKPAASIFKQGSAEPNTLQPQKTATFYKILYLFTEYKSNAISSANFHNFCAKKKPQDFFQRFCIDLSSTL